MLTKQKQIKVTADNKCDIFIIIEIFEQGLSSSRKEKIIKSQ